MTFFHSFQTKKIFWNGNKCELICSINGCSRKITSNQECLINNIIDSSQFARKETSFKFISYWYSEWAKQMLDDRRKRYYWRGRNTRRRFKLHLDQKLRTDWYYGIWRTLLIYVFFYFYQRNNVIHHHADKIQNAK